MLIPIKYLVKPNIHFLNKVSKKINNKQKSLYVKIKRYCLSLNFLLSQKKYKGPRNNFSCNKAFNKKIF